MNAGSGFDWSGEILVYLQFIGPRKMADMGNINTPRPPNLKHKYCQIPITP